MTVGYEPKNEIQKAFLDGIEEVYSTLLCNHALLYFLDEENTKVDSLYGETTEKKYLEPYELIAKVTYDHPKGENPEETVIRKAQFRIPTKQFLTLGIPFLQEADWERMRQAKLVYEGTEYLIDTVKPSTLVADIWQFFEFSATEAKKNSISR